MQRVISIPDQQLESRDYLSEKFSKAMAWIDLQLIAENGVVNTSYRKLAARWKWSKGTTERFIRNLVGEGLVGTENGTVDGTKAGHSTLRISIRYEGGWDKSGTLVGTNQEKAPLFPPCPPPSFSPTPLHTTTPYNPPILPKEKGNTYVGEGQNCPVTDALIFPITKADNLPVSRFVEIWNAGCGRAAKVAKLTEPRKAKVSARISEFGKTKEEQETTLLKVMEKIKNSDFLQGLESTWKITFDFLIRNDTNWVRILEGNYDNNYEYGNNSKHLSNAQRTPTKYKDYGEGTI